jgi:Rad3-related DNA helicase
LKEEDEMVEINQYNPYPSFQPGQKEAITQILDLYEEGQKVIELNAPTAAGKSLDLYVLGRYLSEELYLNKTIYTTPQVALANQLGNNGNFGQMPVLLGKRNYKCELNSDIMADNCPFDGWGEALKHCWKVNPDSQGKPCSECAYQFARQAFMESKFGATTFARYIVDPSCNQNCRALLIDESASLETALINYSTFKIPRDINLADLKNSLVAYQHELTKRIKQFEKELITLNEDWKGLNDVIASHKKIATNTGKIEKLIDELMLKIANIKSIKNQAERDLRACGKAIYHINEGHKYIIDSERRFRLLEGKSEFVRLIENLDLVVLASGTPTTALYADDFKSVQIQHPIALDRRIIYTYPVGRMNRDDRELTAPKMAAAIEKLHAKRHKKTMVHCGAYSIAKLLYDNLSPGAKEIAILQKRKEDVDEGNEQEAELKEREIYKNRFMGAKGEKIFMSVAFDEGLDLKGPEYPMNIIAKIPFEYLRDEFVIARNENDNKLRYYTFAAVKVMQAAGRCTRTPDDFSETWILDGSWNGLYYSNKAKFLPWFKAALTAGSI